MFTNGTKWVRADFHLHTRADKEFTYEGADDRFVSDYIEKLKREKISVGAITNHNKFVVSEYKGIKRKAKQEGITILPGVELSVKEGENGIHCLIIFKEDHWIKGDKEYINDFLNEVFKGIDNREHQNTRCNKDLLGTIKALNSFNKEYFILMAHIEDKSGFYNECGGGMIESLSSQTLFKENVLGFQKVRTRDYIKNLDEWMGYRVAHIEGSDCKSIKDIGKGKRSYIKIGDSNFDSVIQAFKDFENRISLKKEEITHGYIKSIEFKGGKMNNQTINFSPELNCLIGIRGSGKSSVIEAIRYALNMDPSQSDALYKKEVVNNILGSGGQIILTVQDNFQKSYTVKRILGESQHIFDDLNNHSGAQIQTILEAPLYFGQKDLSSMDNGYELNLLKKLVGNVLDNFVLKRKKNRNELEDQIKNLINSEQKINDVSSLKKDLKDIKHKIKIFEEKGISEKLSKKVYLNQDEENLKIIIGLVDGLKSKIEIALQSDELLELDKYRTIESKVLPDLAEKLKQEIENVLKIKSDLEKTTQSLALNSKQMNLYQMEVVNNINEYEEEFAEIKRDINIPNLNPDDFTMLKTKESEIKKKISGIKKIEDSKDNICKNIRTLESQRNEYLLEEFNTYKKEIERINRNQDALEINIEFKGDKNYFFRKLKESFKGANISETSYKQISKEFPDFISLLIDVLLENSNKLSQLLTDRQLSIVKERIYDNYSDYLTITIPNRINIKYHGKPIDKHSIGQRASALVLFILSQKDNNLIMIDQPEDDLDNQVIYNEIIKQVKLRKPEVQFIFATHNANIPVLGDSEQVIAVSYDEDRMNIETGSIDKKDIQNKIVDIMEGGEEAFNKRKEIYNLWTN